MSMQFNSPSYRASSSDLTIAVSPLGLVELADEEFEVHGPRIQRYAANWAWYLGHHYSYRREAGEPQFAMNYVKAFADYLTNFTFSRGVTFRSPEATEAIVPRVLKQVWEEDNDKPTLLWEIGQQGGVSGDVFVKVAFEESYKDPIGVVHPGRVRIVPLNPSHCFPEFHPHDRSRMIRFKLKYRFWGTALEGTRQVFTYTELLTDDNIEEYINDELFSSRPNPLGRIPIVHIGNIPVSSSPWGLSDIQDVIPLNREYNEKALDISDIVNYHARPVTVITGAKAANLERGANKVWAIPDHEARVTNLEMGNTLEGPMAYMALLKRTMHELVGIPENALGEQQAVSNTSGVALAIGFMPLMNRYGLKKIQYSKGLKRVNELILLTLAIKQPERLTYDPSESDMPEPGEVLVLDMMDPVSYETSVHWPDPLPLDIIVKLQEEQMKLELGIQSKVGLMRELGEEFPEEKLAEIFDEIMQDIIREGAQQLQRASIIAFIAELTGMVPEGDGGGAQQAEEPAGPDKADGTKGRPAGPVTPRNVLNPDARNSIADLVTRAYGPRFALKRNDNEN